MGEPRFARWPEAAGPAGLGISLLGRAMDWQDRAGHVAAAMGGAVVAALHLDGAGRWLVAFAAVGLAWILGRISSDILATVFRILLLGVAVIVAFEVLRAGT